MRNVIWRHLSTLAVVATLASAMPAAAQDAKPQDEDYVQLTSIYRIGDKVIAQGTQVYTKRGADRAWVITRIDMHGESHVILSNSLS